MEFNPDEYLKKYANNVSQDNQDFNPDQYLQKYGQVVQEISQPIKVPQDQGFLQEAGQAVLGKLAATGEAIDRYTGAPVRSAISAGLRGENPLIAYGKQFGEDTSTAPQGSDIAQQLGISDKPIFDPTRNLDIELAKKGFNIQEGKGQGISPADVAGFGITVAADPLTYVPITQLVKGAGTAAKVTGKGATELGDIAFNWSAKAVDATTGTKAASKAYTGVKETAKTVGKTAKEITESLGSYFKPTQAEDFVTLKDIAKKNNIDPNLLPESVEFGKGSFISRATRTKAEGPLGENLLKRHEKFQSQLADAYRGKISDISGVGGPLNKIEAGDLIRKSYDEGVDRYFKQLDTTYGALAKQYPNLQLTEAAKVNLNNLLSDIQTSALSKLKRGAVNSVQEAELKNTLKSVDAVLNTGYDFKSTVDLLQDIGKYNYKPSNLLKDPIDAALNRKIYGQLKESIMDTVRSVDPKIADSLEANNKALTKFFGEQSALNKTLTNESMSPETVFKNLIENGDSKKIDALKSVLTPEQMNQIKSTFLDSITKYDADGNILYRSTQNAFKNKQSIALSLLNEKELKDFGQILQLGERAGNPIMSTSGTGASNVLSSLKNSISDAIVSDQVIERMKESARGLKSLGNKVDDMKGLTNKQVMEKLDSGNMKELKDRLKTLSKKNIRSKSLQTYSATKEKDKK